MRWGQVMPAVEAAVDLGCMDRETCIGFLTEVAGLMKDGGAPLAFWEPLVEHGLALVGERHDLLWARLELLRNRFEPMEVGPFRASRWLGLNPEAVEIAMREGDELDQARAIQVFDWRTLEETSAVLRLGRRWQTVSAKLQALMVANHDLTWRHGDVRLARECARELLAAGERYGHVAAQAEASITLAWMHILAGEVSAAIEWAARVRSATERMGEEAHLRWVNLALRCAMAYWLGGDWDALAAAVLAFLDNPATAWHPSALVALAKAALSRSLAGHRDEALQLLAWFTPAVRRLGPRVYGQISAVMLAAVAIWELGEAEFADVYLQAIEEQMAAGVRFGGYALPEQSAARMCALLGDLDKALAYQAQARSRAQAEGLKACLAMADYDEAVMRLRHGADDVDAIDTGLQAAKQAFERVGMHVWVERAEAQLAALAERRHLAGGRLPGGLTEREAEVLDLLARGLTNQEIAERLVLSVHTVERHVANIYIKIDVRNRAEATAYAFQQGLGPPPSAS
ncbi:MAG: helix-turn-helix transcriptional regulator [Anaerolineae bacterium]|nr:helix-turn-helix transcriptional regulator [Anaerolineae bacterium]